MGAAQTINGIEFRELHDENESGTLDLIDNQVTGRRKFLVDWGDRFAFLTAVAGEVQAAGDDAVVISSPVAYPDYPVLRARDARVRGLGKSGQLGAQGMISYDHAVISIVYRNFNFVGARPDDPKDLRSITVTLSGSFLQAPLNHFYWKFLVDGTTEAPEEDREYIDEPIGIVMPLMNLAVTDHRVPGLNLPLWWGAIGKINRDEFEGIEAEHVLYLGLDSRISFNFTSGTPWTITHKFVARSQSWNKFMRPGGGDDNDPDRQWQAIVPAPYRLADFQILFTSI